MSAEKEDAVKKVVEPDQADESLRISVQPDKDPGVIGVEDDAIDVDVVEEEEEEQQKVTEDEDENGTDGDLRIRESSAPDTSTPGPITQADVDVIDLEETDEDMGDRDDGEEGEEKEEGDEAGEGNEEPDGTEVDEASEIDEGNDGDDVDDGDELDEGEEGDVGDEGEEGEEGAEDDEGAEREEGRSGVTDEEEIAEGDSLRDGKRVGQESPEVEAQQRNLGKDGGVKHAEFVSQSAKEQPGVKPCTADAEELDKSIDNRTSEDESKNPAKVPPVVEEGKCHDVQDPATRGEEAKSEEFERVETSSQDADMTAEVSNDDKHADEKLNIVEKVSPLVAQAESGVAVLPKNDAINQAESQLESRAFTKKMASESGAPEDGTDVSDAVPNVLTTSAEEEATKKKDVSENDAGENKASQGITDTELAGPESTSNRNDADSKGEAELKVSKDESPALMKNAKASDTYESSDAKPEDAMELENTEEQMDDDAEEEEHENMDDDHANEDMELSEEEPVHEVKSGGDDESEPQVDANRGDMHTAPATEADAKTADVLVQKEAKQEPSLHGKKSDSTEARDMDESTNVRESKEAKRTSEKQSSMGSVLIKETDVQMSDAIAKDKQEATLPTSGTPATTPSDADHDVSRGGDSTSRLTPDNKNGADEATDEPSEGLGGSPSLIFSAPLFGMRPTGFPSQPVSFMTPPSFQRTSLSPNARPFIPAAQREAMRSAALPTEADKNDNAMADVSESVDDADVKQTTAASSAAAKDRTEVKQLFSPQQAAPSEKPKPGITPPQQSVPLSSKAPVADEKLTKQPDSLEKVVTTDTAEKDISIAPDTPAKESRHDSDEKAAGVQAKKDKSINQSSKPSQKKVTFSLNQPKTGPVDLRTPSSHSGSAVASESGQGRLQEQKLKEEMNDEGFLYEVNHVPLSVRIGNGSTIKRGSLSTLRLTVTKNGEAKLEMFKEGASSLLLFESLSASRSILRVRKVAHRPIVTVTVMTSNNGGTQVAKKYLIHLGHHLCDKVFKACVAHLNSSGPDKRVVSETSSSSAAMLKKNSAHGSSDGSDVHAIGTKRSAEGVKTADPKRLKTDRRKQLQETKAKLLESLKAARMNKASGVETDRSFSGKSAGGGVSESGKAALAMSSRPQTAQAVSRATTATPDAAKAPSQIAISTRHGDQNAQKAKVSDLTARRASQTFEQRKHHSADNNGLSMRKKDLGKDRMEIESPKETQPIPGSLKRNKPAGLQSVLKHAPGKRALDEEKSADAKRQRTGMERNTSAVAANATAQERLKALREFAKSGNRTPSTKGSMAAGISATGRPPLVDVEEVKRMRGVLVELTKERDEAAKHKLIAEQDKKQMVEEVEKLQKALSKASKESEEGKGEVSRLVEEHKKAEKSMADTVAALKKAEQEHKEVWSKISGMMQVVNEAMRAEKVENEEREAEKKRSLSRCDHDNVEDFLCRLRTFKPSTWPVEEAEIGALACARHGWFNSGVMEVQSSDGVTLKLGNLFDEVDRYFERVEEMKTSLVEKHALLSGWRGKQCRRDIGKELLGREALERNAEGLRKHGGLDKVRGFDKSSKNVCEVAAACGWRAGKGGFVCEWCGIVWYDELHLRDSHYRFCMFYREEFEVRRNAELLGLDWEVEGERLGWFSGPKNGLGMDTGSGVVAMEEG